MLWTCGDGKTFFNDENCRAQPRNSHVWTCFYTAAYLTVDTCWIVFKVGVTTPIDRQTLLHHVIAFSNYYIAFWKQDFTVTIGCMFIFLEISTPFVCTRWILFHHGYKGTIFQDVNSILLLFTFILGRVCVQLYLFFGFAIGWCLWMWFEKDNVEFLYKLFILEMFTAVVINMVLNFYWSYLIIMGVYRLIYKPNEEQELDGSIVEKKDDLE